MFSVSYVRKIVETTGQTKDKFTTQTVKTIVIGRDDQTDGLLFYNPTSKRSISSSDYRLDSSKPSGSVFKFEEEQPPEFYKLPTQSENAIPILPPEYDQGALVAINDPSHEHYNKDAHVLSIPITTTDLYTLQICNSNDIIECPSSIIQEIRQEEKEEIIPQAPEWIKNEAKCTIYIPSSRKTSRQGYLLHQNGEWSFKPGRKLHTPQPTPPPTKF
jgi:hypothetical protein